MWQKSSQLTPADCKRLESTFLPNSRLPSIIRHVIVAFFFPPLPSFSSATGSDLSSLNREEYSLAEGGKVGGVEYLGYSREFKSRAKSPGRLLLRANYRPTRLLPIYPRERALLGYGGRAIDGTRASARARAVLRAPGWPGERHCVCVCVCIRVCVRAPKGRRTSQKDEWRKRKKGTSPKCVRLTKPDVASPAARALSPPARRSHIFQPPPRNAPTPYRFVVSRSLYSVLLSPYFHYSLFRKLSRHFQSPVSRA